jgi:hypothetical protein
MSHLRHTGRSRLIADDSIAAETTSERRRIIATDCAFQAALHDALKSGAETLAGVLGKQPREAAPIVRKRSSNTF